MRPHLVLHIDFPTIPDRDREVLLRYGVSDRRLRSSWRWHVMWAFYEYGGVDVDVHVRRHANGAPRWEPSGHAPPSMPWTVLEAAWLAQLATISMLDAAARGRARGAFQKRLPGT